MKKVRNYIAQLDDGHDYHFVNYKSAHRARSRANEDDCRREAVKRFGIALTNQCAVISCYLTDE